MNIRPAQFTDMPDTHGHIRPRPEIHEGKRKPLPMDRRLSSGRTHGNGNPTRTLLRLRKRNGRRGSHILLFGGKRPYLSHIEGKWLNEAPYGVIHRLASNGKAKGIARQCIAWCFARHHIYAQTPTLTTSSCKTC